MTHDVVQYSYVAGEVSPKLIMRSDLEKYDMALEYCNNWFVDHRSGLVTRPGSEFGDEIGLATDVVNATTFQFSTAIANTYLVLVLENKFCFVQNNKYVLAPGSIFTYQLNTITPLDTGLAVGDLVKITPPVGIDNKTYKVSAVAGPLVSLIDALTGLPVTFPDFVGQAGTVNEVYSVPHIYNKADIESLNFEQVRDNIRITHKSYPVYNLKRAGHTNWSFTKEAFKSGVVRPTGIIATPSQVETVVANAYGMAYVITAIDEDGNESIQSPFAYVTNSKDPASVAGWTVVVKWTAVANCIGYNVYRSRILKDVDLLSQSLRLGYVGSTKGTHFIDFNILPDFSHTPPRARNPFANRAITHVEVVNGGNNYSKSSVITVTDPTGTGFKGYVVVNTTSVDATQPISGVVILDGGSGYTDPVFTVTVGTGAVLEATISEASGNYPGISAIWDQRQIYAGSENKPLTFYGSQNGLFSNFDEKEFLAENDSFERELAYPLVTNINDIAVVRGGLLLFSEKGIWFITNSNLSSMVADIQNYEGAVAPRVLRIGIDILYCEPNAVKRLSYIDAKLIYTPIHASLLCPHLINVTNPIKSWAYAGEPYKFVMAQLADGTGLFCTMVAEQDLTAWTRFSTQGKFHGFYGIREGKNDVVYAIVSRFRGGQLVKSFERFSFEEKNIYDSRTLDCTVSRQLPLIDADLSVSAETGDAVFCFASQPVFNPGSVGKHIYGGHGRAIITSYSDPQSVTLRVIDPFKLAMPENDGYLYSIPANTWSMSTPVTVVDGLNHLEGCTVSAYCDGTYYGDYNVLNGNIILDSPAVKVTVGLKYKAVAKVLPPVAQGSESGRKKIVGILTRFYESRGVLAGKTLNDLYEIKFPRDTYYAQADVHSGMAVLRFNNGYDLDSGFYIVQDKPYKTSLLGHVIDMDIGDDKDQ